MCAGACDGIGQRVAVQQSRGPTTVNSILSNQTEKRMKTFLLFIVAAVLLIPGCQKKDNPTTLHSEDYPKEMLTSWRYRDSNYLFLSGIAKHRRSDQDIPENGLAVLLTDQNITCSNPHINSGATIEIKYSDFAAKKYTTGEYEISFRIGGEYFNASFESNGQAGLILVDTTITKKIQGWIALKRQNIPVIDVYGTFEVPFCSTN